MAFRVLSLVAAAVLAGCAMLPPDPPRSDEIFGAVRLGMSQQEIERMLGRPDETMRFSRDAISWDYRYMDTWGYFAMFSVTFDAQGVAVGRLSWRTNDGGDHQ
jgi:outer membrane protein assembly factor BamE (lipoprotein component of BamABCDE complex)